FNLNPGILGLEDANDFLIRSARQRRVPHDLALCLGSSVKDSFTIGSTVSCQLRYRRGLPCLLPCLWRQQQKNQENETWNLHFSGLLSPPRIRQRCYLSSYQFVLFFLRDAP